MLKIIKSSIKKQAERITGFTVKQYIPRLLAAWLMVSFLFFLRSKAPFTDFSYYTGINFLLFLCLTVVLFLFLWIINSDTFITIFLIVTAELYFVCAVSVFYNVLFSFGLCLLLCAMVLYSDFNSINIRFDKRMLWIFICLLAVMFTLFTGIVCCLYYKNYRTPCFDFGLFSQMFYYMKETGECLTTCERDGLLSHFAVHFSPVFYLLLPVYMLAPSPCTLLIAQGVIVASGVVPLTLLCKHLKLSNTAAVLFAGCYLLYPSFLGGCFWYLHENCFLAPFILWSFYFSEKKRLLPTLFFALLTLLVKEDAAVYVAVIALYFIVSQKNKKRYFAVLILSVAYFITVTKLMSIYGEGIMSGRYDNYIYDNGGLFTVMKAAIQNPIYAIQQIFTQEKLIFILQMLVPLAFLPVVPKSPARLILLIPFILVNLITNYPYQYDVRFQYAFGSGAILFCLAAVNYADLGEKRGKVLLCAVLSSVIIFAGGYGEKAFYFENYRNDTEQRQVIDEALSLIPDDASVSASTFLLANLSQREEIYELETTRHQASYVVLDLRYESDKYPVHDYFSNDYNTVFYREEVIGIFQRCK